MDNERLAQLLIAGSFCLLSLTQSHVGVLSLTAAFGFLLCLKLLEAKAQKADDKVQRQISDLSSKVEQLTLRGR